MKSYGAMQERFKIDKKKKINRHHAIHYWPANDESPKAFKNKCTKLTTTGRWARDLLTIFHLLQFLYFTSSSRWKWNFFLRILQSFMLLPFPLIHPSLQPVDGQRKPKNVVDLIARMCEVNKIFFRCCRTPHDVIRCQPRQWATHNIFHHHFMVWLPSTLSFASFCHRCAHIRLMADQNHAKRW